MTATHTVLAGALALLLTMLAGSGDSLVRADENKQADLPDAVVLAKAREALKSIVEGDELARRYGERTLREGIPASLLLEVREKLRVARDPLVRTSLAVALARNGDRAGFVALVEDLGTTRDEAWTRLRRAALHNADAGFTDVDPTRWWKWLAASSDARLPNTRDGPVWFWPDDTVWDDYLSAVEALQRGERERAAEIWRRLAQAAPKSKHAASALELVGVLEGMLQEDAAWKEPADPQALALPERIQWLVYHLRDVEGHQFGQPGGVAVLQASGFWGLENGPTEEENPAQILLKIGPPAIPALLVLLEDRRLTRTVGFWRDFHPTRTVLRNQDAAEEILSELMPFSPYRARSTGAYFSTESPEERARVVAQVHAWVEATTGKSDMEVLWVSAGMASVRDALGLFKRLSAMPGQKPRVLEELHALYLARGPWRPEICEALCELGDTTLLERTLGETPSGEPTYDDLVNPDREDGARFLNARDTLVRLRSRFGHLLPEGR